MRSNTLRMNHFPPKFPENKVVMTLYVDKDVTHPKAMLPTIALISVLQSLLGISYSSEGREKKREKRQPHLLQATGGRSTLEIK